MKVSYHWLKDYFSRNLPPPKKLAELLTMHSFEVESVEKKGRDFVLDIDVLPNRAHDCLCYLGIAREVAAILNLKLKNLPLGKLAKVKGKIKPIEVKIRCPRLVARYSAAVIEGVKIGQSPKWLKEKLKTAGVRPINNIVDLTNFVMLETGQPLHAFDYDKIKEQKMIVRRSKKGEKLVTLDGIERKLDEGVLVIENKNRLIDLVGIMGGKLSEIDSTTKNIVLQAANFDRRSIYLASKKLKHSTDASNIYIQGIDPNLTITALQRIFPLLKKLAGGKMVQLIDIYPKKVLPKKIQLDLHYLDSLLGIKIPKAKVIRILKNLGFKTSNPTTSILQSIEVEVPTRRMDILIQEDLIEEIGRMVGFQNIPSIFPQAALIPPEQNEEIFWKNLCKDILKERGFSEVYNYSFLGEKQRELFGFAGNELWEVENPVSSLNKYLRPSLIPNLLGNIKENLKHFGEIKIFELGRIFVKSKHCASGEKMMLSGVLTRKGLEEEGFYELKGVVDSLLAKLGVSNLWYDEYQASPEQSKLSLWHPKRCAEIKSDGKEIGFLGEVHPKIAEQLAIKQRVFIFDFDFEKLLKLTSEEHEYQPLSIYPAAVRDLAILVPQGTKVVEVLNIINAAGGKLVRDVDLFDVYQGEAVPENRQSFAFHIIYQAEDRTLSSREIDKIHQKIIKALEQNPYWEVRR